MSGPKVSRRQRMLHLTYTLRQAIKSPLHVTDDYMGAVRVVVLRPEDARAILRELERLREAGH